MNKRLFFYIFPMILLLIVLVAGRFVTNYLADKARQEIIAESQASALTLSIYVSSTFDTVEGAVKSLAGSPWIAPALLSGGIQDIEQANRVLDRYNSALNISVAYLLDADGMTVASSNRNDPDSFVGNSYHFRPYFQEAIQGRASRYFALGITSGKRGFYATYPVQDDAGKVVGVVTLKKDIDAMEPFFSRYTHCFLVSPDGIIFLSGAPAMILKSLWSMGTATQDKLTASRQFGDTFFETVMKTKIIDGAEVVSAAEITDGSEVTLEGTDYFVSRKVIDTNGWSIVLMTPIDRIRSYKSIGILATTSVCLLIVILSGIIFFTDQSREAIRQSEESRRLLLHAAGEGIFGVDRRGSFTFVNPAALRMLEYAEKEISGQSEHALIHHTHEDGSSYARENCAVYAAYAKGVETHVTDEVFWRRDGSSFPVNYYSTPIISKDKVAGAVVTFQDITAPRQVETELRESRSRLEDIIAFLPDATFAVDMNQRVIIWNKAMEKMTGVPAAKMIGQGDYAYAVPFHGTATPMLINLVLLDHREVMARHPGITSEGDALIAEIFCDILYNKKGAWVFAKAAPLHDQAGNITGAIESVRDVTDRKKMEAEIRTLSITDQLTGLHNRRGFLSLAGRQLKLSDRNRRGLQLYFADLDGLKRINDTLGHEQGDQVLVEAATILKEAFRSSDILARLGGDEFAALAIDATEANSETFTARLRSIIETRNRQENRSYKLSISVGWAYYDPQKPCSLDELMARADKMMYENKQDKKRTVAVPSSGPSTTVS